MVVDRYASAQTVIGDDMEPVSTVILAAASTGLFSGVSAVAKSAVVDSYEGLKSLLRRKLGGESKVMEALGKLEEDPESAGWREQVQKEVANAGADADPEIVAAAEQLRQEIEALPDGKRYLQAAKGNYIAQAQGGSTANVNVNKKD